jgi:hypothetical protein
MAATAKALAQPTEDEVVGGPGLNGQDAQLADKLLREIRKSRGHLGSNELKREMIARARPAKSPYHGLYEWDQAKGHMLYLLERSGQIIGAVRVVFVETPKEPTRAFRVVQSEGKKGPMPMREIAQRPDLVAHVLEEAKASLAQWQMRYEHLERVFGEIRPVLAAVRKFTKRKRQ